MVHAAVVELQIGVGQALYCQAAVWIVGARGEALADGIRLCYYCIGGERAVALADQMRYVSVLGAFRLIVADALVDVAFLSQQRRVGLLGVDSLLFVHDPRLSEKVAGEEFYVEAGAAEQCLRNGSVKVDGDQETFLIRLEGYRVCHIVFRVYHRVETGEMAA